MGTESDLSGLIQRAQAGDRAALDELFTLTYDELRSLARARLRISPRVTALDTVGLVNESYVRLTQVGQLRPQDRAHLVRYAARAMRSVVVDYARKRSTCLWRISSHAAAGN